MADRSNAHTSDSSGLTPAPPASRSLRVERDELSASVRSGALEASAFPERYAAKADAWLIERFEQAVESKSRGYALIAVGGYGRSQLCPGSDLDLVLLHRGRTGVDRVAKSVWYGIWDDGLRLDHSVRTRREALEIARADLKVILGLLDARHIVGDERLTERLITDARELWTKQRKVFLGELEHRATARHREAGELAFLLEPDLKQSAGGLRDAAALRALSLAVPEIASELMLDAVDEAEQTITAARVALHCRTGRDGDRLLLQEQDQVAEVLGLSDADALMATIADAGRSITATWVDYWRRARLLLSGGATPSPERVLGPGIVLRGGEVALVAGADAAQDPTLLVRVGLAAAERNALIERESLDQLQSQSVRPSEPWSDPLREAFLSLLGTGDALIPVVEALDQRRLFERLLPEWTAVRNRPQRNAYHRFTVDRHLLEAVARASEYVGTVDRPDLLLMGALLHDIGKGFPGDHSTVGEEIARTIATRMGFPPEDVAVLAKLVAFHLVIPEIATRRDLDDPSTARLVGRIVEDRRTLALLTALTEADSRATGLSAWSPWKADLVTTLAERTERMLEGSPFEPPATIAATPAQLELIAAGELAVRATGKRVTVVGPDRPGLLAAAAGALALHRCNVRRATAASGAPGVAVEIFDVEPQFDRLPEWGDVEHDLGAILEGSLDVAQRLALDDQTYARARRPVSASPPQRHVIIDNETSDVASIVEVRALDRMGLLHEITAALMVTGCDVESAYVNTLGHEVIDTFYVRDKQGAKLSSGAAIQRVRDALNLVVARVTDEPSPEGPR